MESIESYVVNVLEHSHLLLCLVLSPLKLEKPSDLLDHSKDLNNYIRTISETMLTPSSKILALSASNLEESKADSEKRPNKCLRRMGCRCIECEPILQSTTIINPKTPLEFSKATLERQYKLMINNPIQFEAFYDKVLAGDSLNFAQSLEEESFLKALNNLILSEDKEQVVKALISSNTFWNMLLLTIGYSDNTR